ncbi:MAG TPA: prepilin-type N-terminal cleavage/methylation domain-containing protein [Candidatus Moranbacteria bacterium]|nr:prepilin-type N-terminal cleavage/methylation domain-containing protein [Candidatus Moranbacteria bacterium]
MKNILKTKNKGFSLIEMLVSIFISTLIMLSVTASFASAFKAQKKAREVQRGIEEAKGALEYMAKIIRMSSNVQETSEVDGVSMYSKSLTQCVRFSYDSGEILEERCSLKAGSEEKPCENGNQSGDCTGSYSKTWITGEDVLNDLEFSVGGDKIKRVTIRMEMSDDYDPNAKLQTTVSARDYKDINPMED